MPFLRVATCKTSLGHTSQDAHALLAQVYARECGAPMPPLCRTSRGKPYLEDSSLEISISHTNRLAFCALSDHPVGLDAEDSERAVRPSVQKRVLSSEEQAFLAAVPDPDRVFLRFWTLKEAYVKFTGTGLGRFPSDLSFSLLEDGTAQLAGSGLFFKTEWFLGHTVSLCSDVFLPFQPEFLRISPVFYQKTP